MDALPALGDLLAEHDLHPVAALLTHGHIDHTWSVVPLCVSHAIPAMIHSDDRRQLSDPLSGLSSDTQRVVASMGITLPAGEPSELRLLDDGDALDLAGLGLVVRHTPGHTPGSIVFIGRDEPEARDVMFAGDLLFAGSVGRTDGPGGNWSQLLESLVRVALPMSDDTVVLPGHGGATTIGHERQSNPYVAQALAAAPQGRQ